MAAAFSPSCGLGRATCVCAAIGCRPRRTYLADRGPDGWPGWYVDRLGDFLLSQSDRCLSDAQQERLADLLESFSLRGACHKVLTRDVRKTSLAHAPQQVLGDGAPEEFVVCENGVQFALSFSAGCSVGLFLDQRDNRRRLLTGYVAAGFPLRWEADLNPPPTLPGEGSERAVPRDLFPYPDQS